MSVCHASSTNPRTPVRAVVLDLGGVLEVNDDALYPPEFVVPARGGSAGIEAYLATLEGVARAEVLARFWRWYVGELDQAMVDWFAGLRPAYRTGILSNSAPGAREAEAHLGFEAICDDLVYSHEVGLQKPDPAVFRLAAERLGVAPEEIVFVDDHAAHVEGARSVGMAAVLHPGPQATPATIAAVEALLRG